ncbi:MAG: PASTA domain-containing protein [Spirochaetes bacterium]|nr:PASTA domain-containing protein [Spirochaetota bacterium]
MNRFRRLWANLKTLYGAFVDSTVRDAVETRRLLRFALLCLAIFFVLFGVTFVALLRFSKEVQVPQTAGKDLLTALKEIQARGLRASAVPVWDDSHPRYIVLSQKPDAGMSVRQGRVVELRVSQGKRQLPMPDFKGMQASEARSRLLELFSGLDRMPEILEIPGEERRAGSNARKLPPGAVISQTPAANGLISPERDIVLVVSRGSGEGQFKAPNYLLRSIATVSAELKYLGIEVKKEVREASRPQDVGRIFGQSVSEGSELQKGDAITFLVGGEKGRGSSPDRQLLRVLVVTVPLGDDTNKKRKVQLVVHDQLGDKTVITRSALSGAVLELPYKTVGAGSAEVRIDGQELSREEFR